MRPGEVQIQIGDVVYGLRCTHRAMREIQIALGRPFSDLTTTGFGWSEVATILAALLRGALPKLTVEQACDLMEDLPGETLDGQLEYALGKIAEAFQARFSGEKKNGDTDWRELMTMACGPLRLGIEEFWGTTPEELEILAEAHNRWLHGVLRILAIHACWIINSQRAKGSRRVTPDDLVGRDPSRNATKKRKKDQPSYKDLLHEIAIVRNRMSRGKE